MTGRVREGQPAARGGHARRYAMTRVCAGDYVCPSNGRTLMYRFSTYTDGYAHGLEDCRFEARTFWRVRQAPMPRWFALDDLPWYDLSCWHATRRAALATVYGP